MGNEYNWDVQKTGLNADFWRRYIRPAVFHIKGYACELCGSEGKTDVHHSREDMIQDCINFGKKEILLAHYEGRIK